MTRIIDIGIDVGSTTVKLIALKDNNILYESYQRHFSNALKTVYEVLNDLLTKFSTKDKFRIAFTGSGALAISEYLNVPFIQEVIACKNATLKYSSSIDVVVELGGEDAKIIYFTDGIEQRMNGSCAGGTGAFLDQMAVLLNTDTAGLNELARNGEKIYSIASRCGVFAKSDIQPLINEGAKKEDIALSIMQAVVNQTISGLACGKPIRGNVMFLGGPLNYLDTLRNAFIKTLNLKENEAYIPEKGHLFVAMGAIYANLSMEPLTYQSLSNICKKIKQFKEKTSGSLKPLFKNKKELDEFLDRHNREEVKRVDILNYKGNAYLGIDAGSTTAKLVLIDDNNNILYEDYQSNLGNPVKTIKNMLLKMYEVKPVDVIIRVSGSTGYGEGLIKTAFNLDISEIETVAHTTAAKYFEPNVTSIIDIGGQDMKYIKLKNGNIDTILLNEACSSGCGSFIETLSKSLDISLNDFVTLALDSKCPVDLGSRCTVFMNSKIKQTQKEGRPLGDIFAGLSYSVIKNALQKVMKVRDFATLGDYIVVQGGTFLNDAVLRALELITEKEVKRPNIAGLMGAFGMALIGKETYQNSEKDVVSSILDVCGINLLEQKVLHTRCGLCSNNCALTINIFGKKRFISGNRCERGSGENGSSNLIPNMYQYKYERLFNYEPLKSEDAYRGEIGIPRVLNMYENYPFWHTLFTNLGFRVILSDHSNHNLFLKGIESIPSESACYPAKIVHGHIMNLISKGVKTIFYPCIMYEKKEFKGADNCYNCPIVTSYSEAIKLNVLDLKKENIKFLNPFLPLEENKLCDVLLHLPEMKEYNLTRMELKKAIKLATEEMANFRCDIINKGQEFLKYMEEHNLEGIVLAGRPYHLDKEINHGIDTLINSLGLAILTEDSICYSANEMKLRVVDQWSYHARIYRVCDVVAKNPRLELVSLNSFGCGLDAIVTDQAEEIMRQNNRLYTVIKIDETSNLGAIKIRLRSLIAAMKKRNLELNYEPFLYEKQVFKKEMKDSYTILVPDMSPHHMPLLASVFKNYGYKIEFLSDMNEDMLEQGLKYVNNDACYPALIVIGQLISALKSGKYDLKKTSVLISQTGGGCRATNYIGLIRKALKDANLEYVPIISFNMSGLEKKQAFKLTIPIIHKLLMAVIYGDLLMKLLYATRPYEKRKNSAEKMYQKYYKICESSLVRGSFREFKHNIKEIIREFNSIPINEITKPKVGIVGEILVKYHYFGNNYLVDNLEKEGAEVIVPELMGFVKYCAIDHIIKNDLLKISKTYAVVAKELLKIIDYYEKTVKDGLKKTRFMPVTNINKLKENVKDVISLGNQTGEGWYLTAEMIELIKEGVPNIVCVQPFGCLPNHIVGKAVQRRIKELYPRANVALIDYDPGASKSNQINRIKLMLSIAQEEQKNEEMEVEV